MHRVSALGDADPLRLVPVPGNAEPVGPCGDRNSCCRYRRVTTRLDSWRTGVAGAGTGRCRPGRSLQALIVRESAPSRLSPVPGGPEEQSCVSGHRSRSPGQRAGACRYRSRRSSRCQSRHHRPQGADTGLAPDRCPGGREAAGIPVPSGASGTGSAAGNPVSHFGPPQTSRSVLGPIPPVPGVSRCRAELRPHREPLAAGAPRHEKGTS